MLRGAQILRSSCFCMYGRTGARHVPCSFKNLFVTLSGPGAEPGLRFSSFCLTILGQKIMLPNNKLHDTVLVLGTGKKISFFIIEWSELPRILISSTMKFFDFVSELSKYQDYCCAQELECQWHLLHSFRAVSTTWRKKHITCLRFEDRFCLFMPNDRNYYKWLKVKLIDIFKSKTFFFLDRFLNWECVFFLFS